MRQSIYRIFQGCIRKQSHLQLVVGHRQPDVVKLVPLELGGGELKGAADHEVAGGGLQVVVGDNHHVGGSQ